jgi:hypothetical protein
MADRPAEPERQPGDGPDRGSTTAYPGTPRRVIVLVGVVLLVVVVLVVTSALGLHTPGGPGGHVSPIKH